jgi:hypothetical protein
MSTLGGIRLIFRLLQRSESLVKIPVERKDDNATDEIKNQKIRNANYPMPSLRKNEQRHHERESQKCNPSDQDEPNARGRQP